MSKNYVWIARSVMLDLQLGTLSDIFEKTGHFSLSNFRCQLKRFYFSYTSN